ncbi:MAG: TIGR00730 family Rossman fold protein [Saprospiraceae bacterium]|nr:TIGR00730 family Rossman fold protein [Saprospiraceae bacterium]
MQHLSVFCGSSAGFNEIYAEAARTLGRELARRGIGIVYGAGNVGLMGVLADAALAAGGQVVGVIPHFLQEKELCHTGLTEVYLVNSMYERKVKMAQLSQGVITLPGGYGTLDELFEMVTLVQLGQDRQPIGLLNINGFFDQLIAYVAHASEEGFIKPFHRDLLIVENETSALIDRLIAYEHKPVEGKWWNKEV